ncbi:MAG: hypothetical protein J6U53_05855, partial [Tidjanibacter sp.]|nr:hypothetical protein [Tidjanibacter sp.]
MRTLGKYMLSLALALVCVVTTYAEEDGRVVEAKFEPQSVLIGDHFDLVVEVDVAEGCRVAFPTITPEFAEGRIELLKDNAVDTLSMKMGRYHLRKSYRLTSFEPAQYRFDSLA